MSDSMESAGFDVEAEESLLENPAEFVVQSDHAQSTIRSYDSARKAWRRVSLLLHSTELFKLAANYAAHDNSSSPSSPTYASIPASDGIQTTQVSGIVSFEISAEPTVDNILTAHRSPRDYEHTIDLQQRENIVEIVKNKNLQKLLSFGGVPGAAEALNTDLVNGISSSPREINRQPEPSQLSKFLPIIISSFRGACNNITILLLFSAAALLLGFGIKEEGLHMGWFSGGVLMLAIFLIVIGTTIRNCFEEWSHNMLGKSKGRILQVRVVRGGRYHVVSETDLEVGDVAFLKKGDHVPCDGLFISGQGLELDEGFTNSTTIDENNPFLFYGLRVTNGNARMLVTSTSLATVWGEMMSRAKETSAENEFKFESYLNKLNACVQIVGQLIFILIIVDLFLRYEAGQMDEERGSRPDPKAEPTHVLTIIDAIKGIITGSKGTARVLITLLSVSLLGIMDGFPFAISIAAIVWSSRTLAHKACERDSFSCIKMAGVTTVCTDKFGGMTEQAKEIDKFYVGEESVSESSVVASQVLVGLCDGIGTQFLIRPNGQESRLLPLFSWAKEKFGMRTEVVAEQCRMIDYSGHNPLQEPCRILMEKNGNGRYLHYNGPAHDILSACSYHYEIDGRKEKIDEGKRIKLEWTIRHMLAQGSVEVIAYACKEVADFDEASFETNELILLAMISMKETKIEDTKIAVLALKDAGVRTVLTSAENTEVLESVGQNCGLLNDGSDDLVLTGETFRSWTDEDRLINVEKIRILGNCLPSDKILLIKCLRAKGQGVAVLAQRTVDAPALTQADIGITYGTWSSEIARECSDITIWNGNSFTFLVNIVTNGRCFQMNIRKFIQLELILALSSSLINFVAVVSWGDAPMTAVQLFWLNLVVGLVGGLALLIGPSTTALTATQPSPIESSAKLITKAMWRNIAIQVSYQTTMFVNLQNKGQAVLGTGGDRVKSIIYNGFFLCLLFNTFVAREPESKHYFRKMHRWFWFALVIFIACQVIFALAEELLGSRPELSWKLWGACLVIGLLSWLLDWAGKMVSDFHSGLIVNNSISLTTLL